MLILAGVSINAIVGDNGILTRTQYASFLNEMAAVEEAVQLWKTGEVIDSQGNNSTAIPTKGMCQTDALDSTERLKGEIGYYRAWSIKETKPAEDILTSADSFNTTFGAELITYPAGIQDLYYLNNEECGIDGKKTYLIDAATGMVYSMTGINLKGVSCYSSSMAKAIMNGIETAPQFAAAEVSGSGSGEKLAGNVQNEFLEDGVTPNPDYNPNGFQIIAHTDSNNIYKLYNNGDLYGKGVKGTQLNSSASEMEKIDSLKWKDLSIPSEIGSYKKIIPGNGTMFVIDSNDDLWAWGNNGSNKLGLTQDQQVEYTGREPVKINVVGKKVKKIWNTNDELFVLTTDNLLYAMGNNTNYRLGIGHKEEINNEFLSKQGRSEEKEGYFQQVDVPTPENIKTIVSSGESHYFKVIMYNDNTFYASGNQAKALIGNGNSGAYSKFLPMWNGYTYKLNDDEDEYVVDESVGYLESLDIDEDIMEIAQEDYAGMLIVKKDKTLWFTGLTGYTSETTLKSKYLSQYPLTYSTGVKHVYGTGYGYLVWKENGEIWGANGLSNCFGIDELAKKAVKLDLPTELESSGIKEIYCIGTTIYYFSNDNELFASAASGTYVGLSRKPTGIEKLNTGVNFKTLYANTDYVDKIEATSARYTGGTALFEGQDGKVYTTGNSTIMYRNSILQTDWKKIAERVEKVSIGPGQKIAYIEKGTKKIYVAGDDARMLDQNISVQQKIPNFIELKDELVNGKASDIQFTSQQMYILTNDGILYSTGLNSGLGGNGIASNFAGWEELEDHYNLVNILEGKKVTMFNVQHEQRMAIADGELYVWGNNNVQTIEQTSRIPIKLNVNGLVINDIKRIYPQVANSMIICNSGDVYYCGKRAAIGFTNTKFTLIDNNFWGFESDDEKIIDYKYISSSAAIVLTNKGNLYAWGTANYLGINDPSTAKIISQPKKVLENVEQITSGNGFFIAVKSDGSVWGTGSNTNGILGRWAGSPRGARYRTAFSWVECLDLEI